MITRRMRPLSLRRDFSSSQFTSTSVKLEKSLRENLTAQQYLEYLLVKYDLRERDLENLKTKRAILDYLLRQTYGSSIADIHYIGSYLKGTAINLDYNLGLCIYFKKNSFDTLKEMYDGVFKRLTEDFSVERDNASMSLVYNGDNFGIVPAMMNGEISNLVELYESESGSIVKTDILFHGDYIKNHSDYLLIRLMKVWKFRHEIRFKSFPLELLTIKALDHLKYEDFGMKLLQVLHFIKNNVEDVKLLDPANPKNVISDIVCDADKKCIRNAAGESLKKKYLEEIIW
jgi:hypothetical protein